MDQIDADEQYLLYDGKLIIAAEALNNLFHNGRHRQITTLIVNSACSQLKVAKD